MPAYDGTRFEPPAPVAIVTLRDPSSRRTVSDVMLLIDSGADVTLLPESAIRGLGTANGANEDFELMAFDGRRTMARSVNLDMLFLGRAFRGRFLLIAQEYGILGRDILNHVSLLLDGPEESWSEQRLLTEIKNQ